MHNTKKFLAGCALLTGIGLVLTGAGAAMGGIVHGIQINSKGIHVYAPQLVDSDAKNSSGAYVQKEEQLEAFDRIEVNAEYVDIRIESSDSDIYKLSYNLYGNQPVQAEVKDGKLILRNEGYHLSGSSQVNVSWFLIGTGNSPDPAQKEYITLYLPKDAKLSEAVLTTDTGDVTCEKIQADHLKITADYGDISLTEVQAQKLETQLELGKLQMEQVQGGSCKVKNEYGDLSFYDMVLSGDMEMETESGNVKFQNTQIQSLSLKSDYGNVDGRQTEFGDIQMTLESGECSMTDILLDSCDIDASYSDVDLKLENAVTDYGYRLKTEYGKIKIAGETMGEAYSSLDQGQEKLIRISCESGDIQIR